MLPLELFQCGVSSFTYRIRLAQLYRLCVPYRQNHLKMKANYKFKMIFYSQPDMSRNCVIRLGSDSVSKVHSTSFCPPHLVNDFARAPEHHMCRPQLVLSAQLHVVLSRVQLRTCIGLFHVAFAGVCCGCLSGFAAAETRFPVANSPPPQKKTL